MSSDTPLKILMISSEAVPFAKSGGLADMTSSLTSHLAELGHDVRLLIPAYGKSTEYPEYLDFGVKVGFKEESVRCFRMPLGDSRAEVFLLSHPLFFRDGIYGNREQEFFPDNSKRFSLLSRAAFSLMHALGWQADILHAHDWPTALVPAYLRSLESKFHTSGTVSVFTIHNIGYQGIFSLHDLHYTRLMLRDFCLEKGEVPDQLNFLKTGILCADYVTTVSPRYAGEIRTPEYGHGLEAELQQRKEDLFGILNGIDTDTWDPRTDPHLPAGYSAENTSAKAMVKELLQRRAGLAEDPGIPLIGIVSRLVEQKGFRELCGPGEDAMERMLRDLGCQIVVLGTGETWCEEALTLLDRRFPNLSVHIGFSEEYAHLIEGGSDFFLMPSRYEPCGLNQMYSLRYGTLPIVRRTGGLADTVIDLDDENSRPNGFIFDEISGASVFDAAARAVHTYRTRPETIELMRKNAMQEDFSWDQSAQRYIELYRYALRQQSTSES